MVSTGQACLCSHGCVGQEAKQAGRVQRAGCRRHPPAAGNERLVRSHPPNGKWTRKRLLDFAQYSESRGSLDYNGGAEGDEPKTEAEFTRWATELKCLTPTGASRWWKELEGSSCKRDLKGRRPDASVGALRLRIPSLEMQERKKGRYIDNKLATSSKPLRKLTDQDACDLAAYATSRPTNDAFLRGEKRQMEEEFNFHFDADDDAGSGGVKAATPGLGPDNASTPGDQRAPTKTVDLALQRAKGHPQATRRVACDGAEHQGVGQESLGAAEPREWAAGRPCLGLLAGHLRFRLHCAAALADYRDDSPWKDCVQRGMGKESIKDLMQNNQDKVSVPSDMIQRLEHSFASLYPASMSSARSPPSWKWRRSKRSGATRKQR